MSDNLIAFLRTISWTSSGVKHLLATRGHKRRGEVPVFPFPKVAVLPFSQSPYYVPGTVLQGDTGLRRRHTWSFSFWKFWPSRGDGHWVNNFKVLVDCEGRNRPTETEWWSFPTLLAPAPSGSWLWFGKPGTNVSSPGFLTHFLLQCLGLISIYCQSGFCCLHLVS